MPHGRCKYPLCPEGVGAVMARVAPLCQARLNENRRTGNLSESKTFDKETGFEVFSTLLRFCTIVPTSVEYMGVSLLIPFIGVMLRVRDWKSAE